MIELNIETLNHEGRGIARLNGKTIFVDGALPGEIVIAEYTRRHPRFDETRVIEIKQPSSKRVEPHCPHFAICGGCDLQHLQHDEQVVLKQMTVLEQLKHFGNIIPEIILPPLKSPSWGYRHKARLGVKYVSKKQKVLVGFHEKNGRYLADISRCEVLHPKVGLKIAALEKLISELSIYNKTAQIEVAISDEETVLIFRHIEDIQVSDKEKLITFAKEHAFQIYLHPNKPQAMTRLWPPNGEELLKYKLVIGDTNIELAFHPTDFTQINPYINQQMVSLAMELLALEETDNVLDLFCGLGNFTLPMALSSKNATGIEGDKKMVERAKFNANLNNITNTSFYSSNLFEPSLSVPWLQQTYDKILLDPPRTGAIEIIQTFPQLKPKRIVYVSCNPATLARDAGELVNKQGYRLVKAGIMDMFPHTKHIESMALFISR